ncbi:succinylglutamate desuccinylase/aspartoacylase family protein [Noviherbaspirillum sp. UKPF54]|uniref:succinylglutamate desuccinylase/aspartoacylase family protein n=1 Tax=Noviherbaspirillum sp. UKPF54 TaxID=2601898 RepID=UPI0011B1C456|nr:succinylglutamate desuccinylase/aspartoacylase family protein [Noviherbaspirillum sp. UKPF54]QDZ26849.1 succinylglutamate desuccinylase [Noviherbaspirillum sp. UKPF54]
MTVKTVFHHSLAPGKTLAIMGGVHGNEYCGPAATTKLLSDLDSGAVALQRGTLQVIPVANPRAYAQKTRFVERNLNRYLYPKEEKRHYEDHLDPVICSFLDSADVLLDLHSYASQGGPFVFLGGSQSRPEEVAFARALGVRDFVCGWSEAFGSGGKGGDKESQGTTEYARANGALAVTLECGHHHNADAADVGYRAILRALAHLEMLAPDCEAARSLDVGVAAESQRCVWMKSVFYKEAECTFVKPWQHFDRVARGEAIVSGAKGELVAPEDGHIILPKASAATGDEWFFFGTEGTFPSAEA